MVEDNWQHSVASSNCLWGFFAGASGIHLPTNVVWILVGLYICSHLKADIQSKGKPNAFPSGYSLLWPRCHAEKVFRGFQGICYVHTDICDTNTKLPILVLFNILVLLSMYNYMSSEVIDIIPLLLMLRNCFRSTSSISWFHGWCSQLQTIINCMVFIHASAKRLDVEMGLWWLGGNGYILIPFATVPNQSCLMSFQGLIWSELLIINHDKLRKCLKINYKLIF